MEVIENGELEVVPKAKLKEAFRKLAQEPESGKPLVRALSGCRSIRVGGSENRLIYRVLPGPVVEILAIGRRRDSEIHDLAERRV